MPPKHFRKHSKPERLRFAAVFERIFGQPGRKFARKWRQNANKPASMDIKRSLVGTPLEQNVHGGCCKSWHVPSCLSKAYIDDWIGPLLALFKGSCGYFLCFFD